MTQLIRGVLITAALVAYAWALANLKPLAQGILVAIVLLALLVDRFTRSPVKRVTFLLVYSIATLLGFVFAGSMLLTFADAYFFPNSRHSMPIGTLIGGAAVGLCVFAIWFLWILRPSANLDRTRRIGLSALVAVALLAVAFDFLIH